MIWSLRISILVIVVAIVAFAGWRLFFGSDYVVSSPSMCPTICVGALVLDEPAGTHLSVGEVISFVPPGLTSVYTHRIVHVFANGSVETKGDAANVVDPWRIEPSMVRGRAVLSAAGLGWIDLALPFLALALSLILILRRLLPIRHRREWDRLFVSVMVAVPIWLLKPLVRGVIVTTSTLRPGVSQLVVVNTGLLPAQFKVLGGQLASFIAPGYRATLTGATRRGGELALSQTASFHWWGWTIVYVFILSPLIWYLIRLAHPSSQAERDLVLRGRYVDTDVAAAADHAHGALAARHDATSTARRDRSRPFVAN
jgi:signal peptidase I